MGDGQYGSTTEVKRMLGISPTDTVDDTILATFVERGDRQVDNDTAGVIETIPVASASITDDLQEASNMWATRLYLMTKMSLDKASMYQKIYRETIDGLINRLKAIPTTRTQMTARTSSYRTNPLQDDSTMTFDTE